MVVMGGRQFVDWALDHHQQHNLVHHHIITNSAIDVNGNTAHAETYYLFIGTNRTGPSTLAMGRYVDRLEKRKGCWGIVRRQCLNEAVHDLAVTALPAEYLALMTSNGPQARDRTDVSYQRPLEVTRSEAKAR
jgi:hypothetical protein